MSGAQQLSAVFCREFTNLHPQKNRELDSRPYVLLEIVILIGVKRSRETCSFLFCRKAVRMVFDVSLTKKAILVE
jgi:hypothetical protein